MVELTPPRSAPASTKRPDDAQDAGADSRSSPAEPATQQPFESPKRTLGGLDADDAATLIAAAADVALIVDGEGIIRDVAFGSDDLSSEGYSKWRGQHWVDTVTLESRPKVEALLRDAASNVRSKGRHVNHTSARGADVPILYSAVQVGGKDRVVAIGRDLRGIAALQHRLVEAQQSMERDYWRLRQVETRYRLLFQMASEPVLIVDATTEKIVEANPAVAQLLGDTATKIVGRGLLDCVDADSAAKVASMLAAARVAGRADDVRVRLVDDSREFVVSATLFRQEKSTFFLVRLAPPEADGAYAALSKSKVNLLQFVETAPDAFVITDPDGTVLASNAAFVELAQLVNEEQARGESLERWLGRPGVDLAVLIANLRQHGAVRLFATTLRGEHGAIAEVEISAVSVPTGQQPGLGFTIRNVGRRLAADRGVSQELPRSVQQLTELVGRVPLKEIVRETTDLIERLCIEAALELTRDNRASAAEMLGLSRQSLYVKLHRYGLGDLASEKDG
jgi:transcriptional regulator PpsR